MSYDRRKIRADFENLVSKTAFGEIKTATAWPSCSFTFDKLTAGDVTTFKTPYGPTLKAYSDGTQALIEPDGGSLKISDDESNLGSATSIRGPYVKYSSGTGIQAMFTCVFKQSEGTPGNPNNHTQLVGIGSINNDASKKNFLGFGYFNEDTETQLSIIHIRGGVLIESIPQRSWNMDTCLGTHHFPLLDWTKGQLFSIQLQYLGFGAISFSIENPKTGYFQTVHKIYYANSNIQTSLSSANICPIINYRVPATSRKVVPADSYMKIGSFNLRHESNFCINKEITGITAERHLLSIKNPDGLTFYGSDNDQPVQIHSLSVGVKSSGQGTSIIKIYKQSVLTTPTFTTVDINLSPIQVDTVGTFVSGHKIGAYSMGNNSQFYALVDVSNGAVPEHYDLDVGDVLTFTCTSTSSTDVSFSIVYNNF